MTDDSSEVLLARWRAGDERAADCLFHRYTEKLVALVRRQLSSQFMSRLDPEDVVQSAYRSFFAGARDDRYLLEHSGDVWRLLTSITLRKLYRQVEFHTAAKRSVAREQALGEGSSWVTLHGEAVAHDPSPSEAAALVEELDRVLTALKPLHRRMVELYLQGREVTEIAAATGRSERLVRLVLEQVREQLEQGCLEGTAG